MAFRVFLAARNDQTEAEVDFKLELVLLPVTDVDRSKHFYQEMMGFDLDVDHQPNEEFRVVQFTPPARRARSPLEGT